MSSISKKIKIALVGSGRIANKHFEAIDTLKEEFKCIIQK
jgi:predicted dehydrogenase